MTQASTNEFDIYGPFIVYDDLLVKRPLPLSIYITV